MACHGPGGGATRPFGVIFHIPADTVRPALALWATAGALKTLAGGLGWLPAVLLGTITATGGAVTRDFMLQRVPAVFTQGTLDGLDWKIGEASRGQAR